MYVPEADVVFSSRALLKGVLAPISGFSLLTIIFLEENQVFWCHALQLARWTIIIVYFNTMYFNFLFRQKRKK